MQLYGLNVVQFKDQMDAVHGEKISLKNSCLRNLIPTEGYRFVRQSSPEEAVPSWHKDINPVGKRMNLTGTVGCHV